MFIRQILLEKQLKSIDDKLDNLFNKVERNNEILNGLINISLGAPPDTVPELDIVKNDPNVICNTCSSISTQESISAENESEVQSNTDTPDISASSISFCLYKYTYIWESNGRNYWTFLLNVDRRTASGYRWFRNTWVYWGIDLRRIDSFICYR